MKYITKIPIAFSHKGKDYIANAGDVIELPECDYVQLLENKELITKQK